MIIADMVEGMVGANIDQAGRQRRERVARHIFPGEDHRTLAGCFKLSLRLKRDRQGRFILYGIGGVPDQRMMPCDGSGKKANAG